MGFSSQPGIEPRPPALGAQSLSCWTTTEVPDSMPSHHRCYFSGEKPVCSDNSAQVFHVVPSLLLSPSVSGPWIYLAQVDGSFLLSPNSTLTSVLYRPSRACLFSNTCVLRLSALITSPSPAEAQGLTKYLFLSQPAAQLSPLSRKNGCLPCSSKTLT